MHRNSPPLRAFPGLKEERPDEDRRKGAYEEAANQVWPELWP